MKSTEFVLLFDDAFIPSALLLNKPESVRKRDIQPRFCNPGREVTGDDMLLLWDLGTRRRRCIKSKVTQGSGRKSIINRRGSAMGRGLDTKCNRSNRRRPTH